MDTTKGQYADQQVKSNLHLTATTATIIVRFLHFCDVTAEVNVFLYQGVSIISPLRSVGAAGANPAGSLHVACRLPTTQLSGSRCWRMNSVRTHISIPSEQLFANPTFGHNTGLSGDNSKGQGKST